MKVHSDPPTALKMVPHTAMPLFWTLQRAQGQDTFELCIFLILNAVVFLGFSSLESDIGIKAKAPPLRFRHQHSTFLVQYSTFLVQRSKLKTGKRCHLSH